MLKRMAKVLTLGMALLGAVLLLTESVPAAPSRPLFPWEFVEAAPQGFGDRQNSGVWSMQWWKGKLYIGTVRSFFCWTAAWTHSMFPFLPYPPDDPDMACAPDPQDLPLQAEIWRYTPETETWERVYQSPNDVEIPDHPGKYTARDLGYRGMTVFEEPDGSEALYVGSTTSNLLWPPMPPPRILRSIDGTTFEPVPQEPGTLLGDLGMDQASFRDMEIYNERLYVINGGAQGQGGVLESENPAEGNDSFRWITPQDMRAFEMATFNGFLYLGVTDVSGYQIVKTDATGTPPYTFTPVVTDGGFRRPLRSPIVLSMFVFKDRLYVGTDYIAEVIRINPDDTWDLVVGTPRETPDGWKYPLSGMDSGFDWPLNVHIWRMQEHEGVLYFGTLDESMRVFKDTSLAEQYRERFGFDLYATPDGYYFRPITLTGFGDTFQAGLRSFASTPYGLFAGSAGYWYGLRIWQGIPGEVYTVYLPLVAKPSGDTAAAKGSGVGQTMVPALGRSTRFLKQPERLEVEIKDGMVLLSWECPPGATRFRIFRSDFTPLRQALRQAQERPQDTANRQRQIPDLDPDAWVPGPFAEIGTTDQFFFVDTTVQADQPYQYYVLAEDAAGTVSQPSNLVRAPSLVPAVTLESLKNTLGDWLNPGKLESQSTTTATTLVLEEARDDVHEGDLDRALRRLEQLRQSAKQSQLAMLKPWRAEDLEILLAKLVRRIRLAQAGIISPTDLN